MSSSTGPIGLKAPHSDSCGGECEIYRAGHRTHWIQARLVRESSEEYREAVVEAVDGQVCRVLFLETDLVVEFWHHVPFESLTDRLLIVGRNVWIHERLHVINKGNYICVKAAVDVSEPAAW
jgi:hypothetical protein